MVWAPVGHAFAFVQDNDLFYQSVHLPTPNTQRITDTPNDVLSGIADWIYEGKYSSSLSYLIHLFYLIEDTVVK